MSPGSSGGFRATPQLFPSHQRVAMCPWVKNKENLLCNLHLLSQTTQTLYTN